MCQRCILGRLWGDIHLWAPLLKCFKTRDDLKESHPKASHETFKDFDSCKMDLFYPCSTSFVLHSFFSLFREPFSNYQIYLKKRVVLPILILYTL